jgi:preprotein translocase SecE subunit
MSWTIYKPGQGYWTRVVTAIGAGLLILAGVQWLWAKLGLWIRGDSAIYVQAAVALVVLAVFGILVYRFVGVRPNTCDFLIATEGEMKKVNWPTRREVFGSTGVVVAFLIITVAILFTSDLFFAWLFQTIGILDIGPQAIAPAS